MRYRNYPIKRFPIVLDDSQYQNYYAMGETPARTFFGRVDLETGTGWEVTIIMMACGKVAVGIDRRGYFIFASKEPLMNKAGYMYLCEKLFLEKVDAIAMISFFQTFFNDSDYFDNK